MRNADFFDRATEAAKVVLRLVVGVMIFQAGALKLFGWFGGVNGHGAVVPWLSEFGAAGWIELIGGVAIAFGLLTRPVAFILSGEMAVAYWQFQAPNGTWPIENQGIPAVLFCFIFLYFAASGAGELSVDAALRRTEPLPSRVVDQAREFRQRAS
jgi:putative oxidoreductase